MKKQVLLAVCALVLSSTVSASNYSVQTTNGGSCSQNEETGSQMEFGTDLDTVTNQGRVFVKWVVQVGHKDLSKIDCSRMYNNEVELQELKLDRLKMEIAALKAQLANPNSAALPESGDDW